uniref:Protein DBF4 homolog A n=1 Tax=Cynoglossus semilaevis TaxID=244447 RepID=A0A3P8ULL0_CYNSE
MTQANRTSRLSCPVSCKPFAGKVFYLDLPSNRTSETLESDIKQLGGTVEKFFSKEIKYLVSNKRQTPCVQHLRQDSPVPSPDSGPSSPYPNTNLHRPGSHGDHLKSRPPGQTQTVVASRGKSLVERVVKDQERVRMNRILSNALEWGVKILYVNDVIAYVQKKKQSILSQCRDTAAVKTKKLISAKKNLLNVTFPFLRHYRPIYLSLPNKSEFNLHTVPPFSPFYVEDKFSPWKKTAGKRFDRAHGRKKRNKKRGSYCECCKVKYENLRSHLQSECHKAFSKSDEYSVVDRQISTLHFDFITIREQTLKEEQQQTVDRESNSGHAVKTRSAPVSTSLIRKDRRNHSSYSCRSRSKSQAAKRLCGQNSWTCGPQTRDHAQMSLDRRETVSPEGEGHVTASCSAAQVDTVDQISQNSSSSLPQDATTRSDSLRKLNVTKPPEETETHEGLPQFESVQDGAADDRTENTHVPAPGFSAVRKIQRRVRIYKRKRRKIETCVLGGQSNGSHNSLLRLFQSSDDMDVEFHGFEF